MNRDNPRALIRYALVGLALTIAIAWTMYLVRGALLLIYLSVLVAIGLARWLRQSSAGGGLVRSASLDGGRS